MKELRQFLRVNNKILKGVSGLSARRNNIMSYYQRCEHDQIYAAIAQRLGKIVKQYEKMMVDLAPKERYEATLCIAVLQNLLTIGTEYGNSNFFDSMLKALDGQNLSKKEFKTIQDFEIPEWGLKKGCWIENTFTPPKNNLETFILNLRNSICHTTCINITSSDCGSGYTTINDKDGKITKFRFINAHRREIGTSTIELSVEELRSFVKCYANYLAQPIDEEWEGAPAIPLLEITEAPIT